MKSTILICEHFGFKFLLHTYLENIHIKRSVLRNIFERISYLAWSCTFVSIPEKIVFKLYLSTVCYIFKQGKSSYSILLVYKHFQFARFVSENIWQRSLGQEAQSDRPFSICLHTYYLQCCYIHMYCVWLNLSTYLNTRCQ